MHGKISLISHSQTSIFARIDQPMLVMRYHSWVVDIPSLPSCLKPIAFAQEDQSLMAFEHETLPLYGVQFHPESVGTPFGDQLIANFFKIV